MLFPFFQGLRALRVLADLKRRRRSFPGPSACASPAFFQVSRLLVSALPCRASSSAPALAASPLPITAARPALRASAYSGLRNEARGKPPRGLTAEQRTAGRRLVRVDSPPGLRGLPLVAIRVIFACVRMLKRARAIKCAVMRPWPRRIARGLFEKGAIFSGSDKISPFLYPFFSFLTLGL